MQKKPKSEYFLRIFFASRRMRAANTSWQMRAARLQVNRQTKCRQKGTGGKTAIRHISAANSRPLRQYTFARIFSYTEKKIYGMQPLYSRRPLPYIRHLTGGHRLPTSLIRHLFSRKLFQLCINFSFRLLHFAIQKCIRISKLFICIRLLAIKHSHNLF
mgnify:CR=1 FL=1